MRECDICYKEKSPLKRLSGMLVCQQCEENSFFKCEKCGKRVYVGNLGFNTDKHIMCKDCSILYDDCMCCGELLDRDDDLLCKECEETIRKEKCPICGETAREYVDYEFEGKLYCTYCYHQTFETCEECEETFPKEQVNRERTPYMCKTCIKECNVIN